MADYQALLFGTAENPSHIEKDFLILRKLCAFCRAFEEEGLNKRQEVVEKNSPLSHKTSRLGLWV